jgi:branched-chain amino acid aminotransferase
LTDVSTGVRDASVASPHAGVKRPAYVLLNGEFVEYADARVHVLSTAFKYGAIAYEGLRAYWNEDTGQVHGFRFDDHFMRLLDTLRLARIPSPLTAEGYTQALVRLVERNGLREDLHCRVQVFVETDDGGMGASDPVSYAMAAMPMGRFFETPALKVAVSSWLRSSDRSMPPRAKVVANYFNSRLALMQAKRDGYDDAVILTLEGKVAEGPGYNIFLVRRGQLVTPRLTDSILEGVTRDTLIRIAAELGIPCIERSIDRSELYLADEMFFCGSAAEISPIASVDGHAMTSGAPGPITSRLHERYRAIVRGDEASHAAWLTPVYTR